MLFLKITIEELVELIKENDLVHDLPRFIKVDTILGAYATMLLKDLEAIQNDHIYRVEISIVPNCIHYYVLPVSLYKHDYTRVRSE